MAAHNILAGALRSDQVDDQLLARVERRRRLPTVLTQRVQMLLQSAVVRPVLTKRTMEMPLPADRLGPITIVGEAVHRRACAYGARCQPVSRPLAHSRNPWVDQARACIFGRAQPGLIHGRRPTGATEETGEVTAYGPISNTNRPVGHPVTWVTTVPDLGVSLALGGSSPSGSRCNSLRMMCNPFTIKVMRDE